MFFFTLSEGRVVIDPAQLSFLVVVYIGESNHAQHVRPLSHHLFTLRLLHGESIKLLIGTLHVASFAPTLKLGVQTLHFWPTCTPFQRARDRMQTKCIKI
jgi:hypothetical protein